MTRRRDELWVNAEQLGNRFRCRWCKGKFAGGILKIRSHLARIQDGDLPPCPLVPEEVFTQALQAIQTFQAITSQKKKTKSLSHPTASMPLTDIQKIDMSKTSTQKGQGCLDDSLPKHVSEISNRAEIHGEGGEMTRKRDRLQPHAEQLGNHSYSKCWKDNFPSASLWNRPHIASIRDGDISPCTIDPQHIQTKAAAAITPQKKKTKSLSHPTASTPLIYIQEINTSEMSTEKGQDCPDESLPKYVPESSNRAKIRGEGFTEPNLPAPKDKSFGLCFMTSMPSHIFTDTKVQGDQGTAIQVALLNLETRHVVQSGPGSAAKLNLVILDGESEELDTKWDEEGKPILSGDLVVTLEGGKATLGDFTFKQDSSRTRSGKYRLGVKVACRCYAATHIQGAVSEAFTVEDSHGEFGKKQFPVVPSEYVWRLVGVAKDGQAHKQLVGAGIIKVRDFLDLLCLDEARLRNIVDGGISDAMWKHTLEHARSHASEDREYVHYFDKEKLNGILFNWNFEPKGLIRDGFPQGIESGGEKVFLESQRKIIYEHPDQVSEYHFDLRLPEFNVEPSC